MTGVQTCALPIFLYTVFPSNCAGTNPASASMCGMKVVVVASDEKGNIDLEDLKAKALKHKDTLVSQTTPHNSLHFHTLYYTYYNLYTSISPSLSPYLSASCCQASLLYLSSWRELTHSSY